MKYLLASKRTKRILVNRLRDEAPKQARPQIDVVEIDDADVAAVESALKSIPRGSFAKWENGAVTTVAIVDAVAQRPFRIQLKQVLSALPLDVRRKVTDKIASSYVFDDPAAMHDALVNDSPPGLRPEHEEVVDNLKVIVAREIAKREL